MAISKTSTFSTRTGLTAFKKAPLVSAPKFPDNDVVIEQHDIQIETPPEGDKVARMFTHDPAVRQALHDHLKKTGKLDYLLDNTARIFAETIYHKDAKNQR